MINKEIGAQKFDKLPVREMIANRCETEPGWNAAGSSKGAEKGCFADTVPVAACQYIAGPEMFRKKEFDGYRIPDAVAYRVKQLYGFCHRIVFSPRTISPAYSIIFL